MNINDVAALVTGGASGLGLATARHLRKLGVRVEVLDLPPREGAHEHLIMDDIGFSAGDVRSADDVDRALDRATSTGLPLRIAVNCAGVVAGARLLSRKGVHPLEDFERTIGINLIGTFNVTRLAAARMSRSEPEGEERGVVVNTASIAAFDGQIGQAAYAASKAGVSGLTLPLARDLADYQIRVVSIAPGLFETPMIAGLPEAARASLGAQVPHPSRLGRPEEFAALVEHIISNPMLNGETIRLDGAVRMAPR